MDNNDYLNILKSKLDNLSAEISILRNEVGNIFAKIDSKQEQAHHILELLSAEGYKPTNEEKIDSGQVHITDIVEAYLKERSSKTPIHYRDLSEQIQSEGHFIPGKDPAANLLSQVNRDERFVRVSSGTYGLREWGLEPAKTKKSRRKKK